MLVVIKRVCGHVKPLVLLRLHWLEAKQITTINEVQGWAINVAHGPL